MSTNVLADPVQIYPSNLNDATNIVTTYWIEATTCDGWAHTCYQPIHSNSGSVLQAESDGIKTFVQTGGAWWTTYGDGCCAWDGSRGGSWNNPSDTTKNFNTDRHTTNWASQTIKIPSGFDKITRVKFYSGAAGSMKLELFDSAGTKLYDKTQSSGDFTNLNWAVTAGNTYKLKLTRTNGNLELPVIASCGSSCTYGVRWGDNDETRTQQSGKTHNSYDPYTDGMADSGADYFPYMKPADIARMAVWGDIPVDNTAPSVSVTGVAVWQSTDATATVSCSDSGSGCDSSTYRLKTYSSSGTCSTTYTDYTLTSPQTISSNLWVCATGKDSVGNAGFSSSRVEFKIDKTLPTASLSGVPSNWQSTDASITLTCSDTGGSGCSNQNSFYLDTDSTCPAFSDSIYGPPRGDVTVSSHKWFCYSVVDNAGNRFTSTSGTEIKVDKTDPSGVSVSYTNNYETDTTARVTVSAGSDSESGITSVQLYVKSTSLSNDVCGTFPEAWTSTGSQTTNTTYVDYNTFSGYCYKFKYTATNGAGLSTEDTSSNILKVDATVPSGGRVSNINGYWGRTSITVTVNRGSDLESGMSSADSDYFLSVSSAQISNSGTCGNFGAYQDANVDETADATSYTYTATSGNCYKFGYRVTNKAGLSTTYSGTDETIVETSGVVTTATLSGTLGNNNWYTSDVDVTLECADSGANICAGTWYRVGTTNTGIPNQEYTGHFSISNEGIRYLRYRSYGTTVTEATKWQEVKIDKTNPSSVSVTADPSTVLATAAKPSWEKSATATVSCSDSASGCDSGTFRLKTYSSSGSCSTTYSDYTLSSPATILDHVWVCAAAKDNAGRERFSSAGVEFLVDSTPPSVSVTHSPALPTTLDQVTITAAASDTGGPGLIRSIYIYVDGEFKNGCASSYCTYASTYTAGTHTYYATATDWAGNPGRDPITGTKSFTVSTPPCSFYTTRNACSAEPDLCCWKQTRADGTGECKVAGNCAGTICGNGIVEVPEVCDKGLTYSGATCNDDCSQLTETACGDSLDNDGNGRTDCYDSNCLGTNACIRPVSGTLTYSNGTGVGSGKAIDLCNSRSATTNSNSVFSYDMTFGGSFCVKAPDITDYAKGAVNARIGNSYEYQRAGITCASETILSCNAAEIANDLGTNYDFVYTPNYDFEMRAAVESTVVLGDAFELKVDIYNKGALSDSYNVSFAARNPLIVYITNPNATTGEVNSGRLTAVPTLITSLVAEENSIIINVTSQNRPELQKIAIVSLNTGKYSLPEFGLFGFIQIIVLSGIVYFLVVNGIFVKRKRR